MFKNIVAADMAVFINPDEFGEPHNIDGKIYTVVVDNEIIHERPSLSTSGSNDFDAHGVYLTNITFFIKEIDLGYIPVENQPMEFDGLLCTVRKVIPNVGIVEVMLDCNQS
ncbi:hypothetical protein [Paenibacillus agilis]|uniref:Uncharacterized protein n=1 Tax=Paenibacillus agilis TaxID=3020863 RepID=A0A559IZK3_9BACL|nr:hypothetical protein [Paenibacillus agilis]TVX93043.1 hypothetical protein FPZ44_08210 [Paenibacillus agilis]